jgi:AraC-like DNA-binding protein
VPLDSPSSERRILPDGSVDLVWRDGRLLIAGPDTSAWTSSVPPGETVAGLRTRPGIGGAMLGLPASELRNARASAVEVWGRAGGELSERLGEKATPAERRALLAGTVKRRLTVSGPPDSLVLAASRRLGFPGSRVTELADALGISDRQLRRRFDEAIGYGPKTLHRILRFGRFVAQAPSVISGAADLARIAAELGYADQAHLSRDCLQLSGLTPRRLVKSWIG